MKNLATFKNDICLIAGSGFFTFEAASYLDKKGILKKIILLSKNDLIKKKFQDISIKHDLRNLEIIINELKKENIKNVIILGYVKLPPINEIKLSLRSKIHISKDFFLNNINQQSIILKNFLLSKNINLISQKKIFKDFIINKNDQDIKKQHKYISVKINKNISLLKKIFKLNLTQSLIMNGNRIIALEDINGTDNLIKRFNFKKQNFDELIFVKSKKHNQIDEIDFPVIGLETINMLLNNKFKIICLFNNQIIISNKTVFLDKIKKSNISLIVL
tara:strand:- start:210 stop:1034 length:825 start_codon:yes stop_codon:yes gene_type:complete